MKILVTGSSGFIGTELVKELLKNPKNFVVGVDLKESKIQDPRYHHVIHDLRFGVPDENFDKIFHLAAKVGVQNFTSRTFRESFLNNTLIDSCMITYLELHPQTKIYFASSSEVYGSCKSATEYKTDLVFKPGCRSAYSVEKLHFETYLQTRPGSVILRFFNICGYGQDPEKGVVSKFYDCIKNNKPITLFSTCSRSFCDVRDAVQEVLAIPELVSGIFNIGSDLIKLSINELLFKMFDWFGKETEVKFASPQNEEIIKRSPNLKRILKFYRPVFKLEDVLKSFPKI